MASPIDFMATRNEFLEYLQAGDDLDVIKESFSKLDGSAAEKKGALDQAFREMLKQNLSERTTHGKPDDENDENAEPLVALVNTAIEAVNEELCSSSTPFLMLSDIFDVITLEGCEKIFSFVEDRVSTWKEDTFYNAGKNYLLRMCNDLLRRMSRSQNTIFCGRIQLFLAVLFPLTEKSGLNLASEFNLDNVTRFNKNVEEIKFKISEANKSRDESMEIEEGEAMDDGSLVADYNLYRKFWSIQDFFRKPAQCYEKVAWRTFSSYSDEVLKAFESSKLDDTKSYKKSGNPSRSIDSQTFFAKYLTSEKLLDLQLSDSNFRRCILVQFLILFKYLNSTVKFKTATMNLTDDQSKWVKTTTDKVYELVKETPPDGADFAQTVRHILDREDNWNSWKNSGCPSYIRETDEKESKPAKTLRPRKRSIGEDVKASGGKLIKMGSAELTRLWNMHPDNLEACKSTERVFLPTCEDFFEEAADQADPEQQVEDQYKLVNRENFSWRSLRLLAHRSPFFFAQNNQPFKNISSYLESTILKIAKQMPTNSSEDIKDEVEDEELKDDNPGEVNSPCVDQKDGPNDKLTKQQIDALAIAVGKDWKKLALELNFFQDEIDYWAGEGTDAVKQARNMVTVWVENEGERAVPPVMQSALIEIGLVGVSDKVFGRS